MSIAELSSRIESREISPVEVTTALLDRINEYNDEMHIYITVTQDEALEHARAAEAEILAGSYRGPLHGVPFSLKDNVETKGIRTTCASLVNPDWVPDQDATVYAKLRDAGVVLAGKANLYEYAFSMNPAYPPAINPWNPERTSAGSSSGSGAGVAAGLAHGSIGSDTGGSGRSPANVNGVVGLKATYGRVSRFGLFPLSFSLDHTTVVTRRVRDSALVLKAIAGHDPNDEYSSNQPVPDFSAKLDTDIKGMRIGLARGFTHDAVDPEVVSVTDEAVTVLERLGADVSEVQLPLVQHCVGLQMAIMYSEAAAVHHQTMREVPDKFGEPAFMRLDLGSVVPATAYIHAQRVRKLMRDEFERVLREYDVIVGPAAAGRAGLAGTWTTVIDGKEVDIRSASPEYTGIYNLAGMPALVLPAGFSSDETPIGIQFASAWFDEATLLQVAHAYEQATEWHSRKPPCRIASR